MHVNGEIWDLTFLELYQLGFSLLCLGNYSSFQMQLEVPSFVKPFL